jgi:hypothetical protein
MPGGALERGFGMSWDARWGGESPLWACLGMQEGALERGLVTLTGVRRLGTVRSGE